MTTAALPALIAVDWGTTSARAYRVDASGVILGERALPLGIANIVAGGFAEALDALLGDWRDDRVPRIGCGMIGSRQGWVEAPYVDCPVELAALGDHLTPTPGGELSIVAGARCRDRANVPDVMRGEETQLAGVAGAARDRAIAVLPGTHSKWALLDAGRLLAFATFMTGELYAVLLGHSILGRMAAAGTAARGSPGPAFADGVARGAGEGGLSHAIFGARTLPLCGELAEAEVGDWLSGVLIGDEIAAARRWAADRGLHVERVTVIGAESLAARYALALAQCGLRAERAAADSAARGMFTIARRAGLVQAGAR